MESKNIYKNLGKLRDELWNARMDALELNWLTKISSTCAEYQQDREQLEKKRQTAEAESAQF